MSFLFSLLGRAVSLLFLMRVFLLPLMAFSPGASGQHTISLLDYTMVKDVNKQTFEPIDRTNEFLTTDELAYIWIKVGPISGTHTVQWKWFSPDDSLYYERSLTIGEGGKTIGWLATWDCINIRGKPPGKTPDQWSVDVYLDGELLLTEWFMIKEQPIPEELQVTVTACNELGIKQNLGNVTGTPLLPINPLTGKGGMIEIAAFVHQDSHDKPATGQPVTVYSTLKADNEQIAQFEGADSFTCADGSLAVHGITDKKGYFRVRLIPLLVLDTKAYADAKAAKAAKKLIRSQHKLLLRKNFGAGTGTIRIGAEAGKLQKSDKPAYSATVEVTLFEIVAEFKVSQSLYNVTYSPYVKEAYGLVNRRRDKGLSSLQSPGDVRDGRSSGGSWSTGYSYAGGLHKSFFSALFTGSHDYFWDQGIRVIAGGAGNGSMSALAQTPLLDGFTPDIRDPKFGATGNDPFQYAHNKIVSVAVGYNKAPISLRTYPPDIWQGTLKSAGLAFRGEAIGDLKLYTYGNAPIVDPGDAAATALGALFTIIPGTSPLFNIGSGALLSELASMIRGNAWLKTALKDSLFGKRDASVVANFATSVYSYMTDVSQDKQTDGDTITLSKSATRLRNDCGTKSDILLTLKYYASTKLLERKVAGICALNKSIGLEPEGNRVLKFNRQFRNKQPLPVGPKGGPVIFLDAALAASAIRSNERAYAAINVGLSEPLLRIINVEFGK